MRDEIDHAEREQYLLDMLNHLPCGVSIFDDNLNLVLWNDEFKRLLRFPDELFTPTAPDMATLTRFNAERGEYGKGDVEIQIESRLARARLRIPHVFERTTPDGVILEIRGTPLPDGGFVTTYSDITERKEAYTQYRATLENASIGIMFTHNRKLVLCNKKNADIFGYDSPDEMVGLPGASFWVSEEYYQHVGSEATPILSSGGVYSVETTLRRKNGTTFLGSFRAKAIDPENTSAGTIWITEDVTERREAEKKLHERTSALQDALAELGMVVEHLQRTQKELVHSEKLAALGAMVAGIAHELNTPIGNCMTAASYLVEETRKMSHAVANGLRKSELEKFLDANLQCATTISNGLKRAAELVSSFKQVAADRANSSRRKFDLLDVVSEVVAIIEPSLRKTSHQVAVDIPAGIKLDSYPGPLGQVMTNLINNAIVHGLESSVDETVLVTASLRKGSNEISIRVEDKGSGIPPDVLPRIFDPFYTTKLGSGGSGLGLSITHNIVTAILGGKISVESSPGSGCMFEIVIPIVAPTPEAII